MIRIAVCDDEERERNRMKEMLEEYKGIPVEADTFADGEELLKTPLAYDIILLDIDMEGMNGIETARQIRVRNKEVKLIYVTNYSDYTIFAFAVHAFAYLMKPLVRETLYAQLEEAVSYGISGPDPEIEFHTTEGIVRIKPSCILYFEYLERYVVIHTKNGCSRMRGKIAETARQMEMYGFGVPHKSFVVNLHEVQNIRGYEITMTDGAVIPLSQKKSVGFRRALNSCLAGERR